MRNRLLVCLLTMAAAFSFVRLPVVTAQAQSDDDDEKSIAPWVVGGILIGGGAAAAIALSQDDDDDDDDDAAPAPGPAPAGDECEESDMVGTWTAPPEVAGTITTKNSFTLNADGSAGYSTVTEDSGPPPTAMGAATMGSWSLSGCDLDLDGSPFGGGGTVSGNSVTTGGQTFTK